MSVKALQPLAKTKTADRLTPVFKKGCTTVFDHSVEVLSQAKYQEIQLIFFQLSSRNIRMTSGQVGFIVFLFGLVLVCHAADQAQVNFLPVLFISPAPDRVTADSAVMYAATVCDGKLYNGNLTVARVNLPYGWNPTIGSYAKIEVCNSIDCTKIYCSNWVKGKFNGNHYCNYTYNVSMGDIYLRVTAGPSPNIDWTVAVEFVDTKTWTPPRRISSRDSQAFEEPVAKRLGVRGQLVVLTQIVKTATKETVVTLGTKEFFFRFCPDRQTGDRYDITIATMGTDSLSAMATYVCLPSELPCGPISSTHYDPRGIGINTVTMTTGSSQLSELHVLIVGWGDSGQTNTFELGATVTKLGG